MGASLGASAGKSSVDIELNIIPFIDLMSVLASFLLATAVWVDNTQIPSSLRTGRVEAVEPLPTISVLVQAERIWIGATGGDVSTVEKGSDGAFDWTDFEAKLAAHKTSAAFIDRADVEIAAESTATAVVSYQELVAAMDHAKLAGFTDPGVSDPSFLSNRPLP